MSEWRIQVNQDYYEDGLFDVDVTETANPFGDVGIAYIDDSQGNKFDQYPRGTRVDFEVRESPSTLTYPYGQSYGGSYGTTGESWQHRLTGYVVERRELDREGADALEVECYSFDQFLRRNEVSTDLSGKTISEALESIVTTDTPVSWVASNVTVGDDQTLTRSYRGKKVENALQSLRDKSVGEDFGVNENLEFYFEPRESSKASRGIDDTNWFNYDIPEVGKETVNEVTVYYNDGNESVTVDDGGDKLGMQDKIGTPDPVTFSEEVKRPGLTDIDDARDVGESILNGRSETLTGTVTTYGLLDVKPGDVIDITITPRGIDGEFRIAEVKYRWGEGATILTIVEKKGDQDDLLVRLSDTVKRVELEGVDRDGTNNVITSTSVGVTVDGSGDVDGTAYTAFSYTNTGRNLLRDAWIDYTTISVSELAVGDDATTPSRTDTSLGNELERVSVSQSLPDSTSVEWTADFSTTSIREVGLFDANGDLLGRATVDPDSLSSPVTVTLQLSVANDLEVDNGVVTDTGQTVVRDVLADNAPSWPTQYAYGSDGSDPSTSDTALGNEQTKTTIDEKTVQSADTDTEWNSTVPGTSTVPVEVSNGTLRNQQSCFFQETFDDVNRSVRTFYIDDTEETKNYSGGDGVGLRNTGDFIEYEFTNDYTIPAENFWIAWRYEIRTSDTEADIDVSLDGETLYSRSGSSGGFDMLWRGHSDDYRSSGWSNPSSDVESGTHTVRIEATSDGAVDFILDCIAPFDDRYSYNWDDSTHEDWGDLDGPEPYPNIDFQFDSVSTQREFSEATLTQTWDDTSNQQKIELSNDGGSTWQTATNSSSLTATFSESSTTLDTRVGLSRYPMDSNAQSATPRYGYNGQSIDVHDLIADIKAISPSNIGVADVQAIVDSGVLDGVTIREGGQLTDADDLLTRAIFAEIGPIDSNQQIVSSESIGFRND